MSHAGMFVLGIAVAAILFANINADEGDLMRGPMCVLSTGAENATDDLFEKCMSENYSPGKDTNCYPVLGCFPTDYPWTSILRPLPAPNPPQEVDVKIYCYTRRAPNNRFDTTLWPEVSLGGCPFDAHKPTMLVTHGWNHNGNLPWLSDMKDSYLKAVDANVFIVDWGRGATVMNYLQGASNTRIAGAEIGRFVNFLISELGLLSSKVHLIGHSLGAQVMSYAGKRIPHVGHFTALDPAQPAFEGCDTSVRVTKTDADFVEVVHTNALPLIPTMGFGMIAPVGDVDFYLNGGIHQPGCSLPPKIPRIKSIKDLGKLPKEAANKAIFCSHERAFDYYTRVLSDNCMIWGRRASFTSSLLNVVSRGRAQQLLSKIKRCDGESCLPMGLSSRNYAARGVFAASTRILPPYCETNPKVNKKIMDEIKKNPKKGGLFGLLRG